MSLREMTDEQAFAWLRERVPSAGDIEAITDPLTHETVIRLHGAEEAEAQRLRTSFGLMLMPWIRVEVR